MAIATILNMVTALVTEADKPAIKAKLHKTVTSRAPFKSFPCLKRSMGLNTKLKINKMIPMCNPDMAKIWMAPALV